VRAGFRRYLPTITWIRWGLAPALIFIAACVDRGYQTDFWHHLARGREIVGRQQVVNSDLFTFTIAGEPIQDANWLTQVIYFHLFQWGGISLVQLMNAIVLAATMLVLVRNCKRASGSLLSSMIAASCAFLGTWQLLLIRPQTISLLLFVLLYWVLEQIRVRRSFILLAPLIMALWANVHGGFAIGLVLIGAFVSGAFLESILSTRRQDGPHRGPYVWLGEGAVLILLAGSATLLNPYGWRIYQYVGVVASRASGRHIEEWLPPALTSWVGFAFAASVVAIVVLYRLARRFPTARELCLLICFFALGCRSVRMLAWWWLIVAPIFATLLAQTGLAKQKHREQRPSWAAAAGVVLLLAICLLSIPQLQNISPLFGEIRSSHRTEEDLQALAPRLSDGRVFTRLEWGEYLDWSLGPKSQSFIDGRIEAYPDPIWRDYCTITSGAKDWQAVLDRWKVNHLLLDRQYHAKLIRLLKDSKAWQESAHSGAAVVFTRGSDNQSDSALAVDNPDF